MDTEDRIKELEMCLSNCLITLRDVESLSQHLPYLLHSETWNNLIRVVEQTRERSERILLRDYSTMEEK